MRGNQMGRRLGLVVGVNHYQDNTFQPLQFAENDARVFAQWLTNSRGGKWAPTDVQYVHGVNATRDSVESLVLQLCLTVAQPTDLVLIYIASHAFIDERSGDGYLALTDTTYRDAKTGLHLLSIAQQVMPWSRAAQIVFMLDSFQTGQGWSTRRTSPYDVFPLLGPSLMGGLQQHPNRVFLCSCRGNEFGAEASERGLGLFMHRMVVGMSGPGIDATTGNITMQSLYTYLVSKLGKQQRPQIFGQAPTSIVLVSEPQGQQIPQTSSINTSQPVAAYASANTQFARQEAPMQYSPYNAPLSRQESPMLQNPYNAPLSRQGQESPMLQNPYNASTTAMQSPFEQARAADLEMQQQQQSKQLLDQASQLFQMRNTAEALQFTNQALHIAPDNSAALILKGQILGTMGQFPEALAIIGQARQRDPKSPLVWSMGAVLLTNLGRHEEALTAIERSLELDASNPESYAIKTNIMASIASTQQKNRTLPKNALIASEKKRNWSISFLVDVLFQFVALLFGFTGGIIATFLPTLPIVLPLLLESIGLAILCVNAARSAYSFGFRRVIVTFFFSLLAAGILGVCVGVRPVFAKIMFELQAHPAYLLPLLFLGLWIAVAATLPLLLAILGFIVGAMTGVRRKKR